MLELEDDKLGKIKVLNVTDVRAHFATVLADQTSSYIITKNNRPRRVIISYEDFERLQNYLKNDPTAEPKVVTEESAFDEDDLLDKPAKKKPAPNIKGLLANQIALSQAKPERKPLPKRKAVGETSAWLAEELAQPTSHSVMSPQTQTAPKSPAPPVSCPVVPPAPKTTYAPPAASAKKAMPPAMPRYESADDYFKSSDQLEDDLSAERILPQDGGVYLGHAPQPPAWDHGALQMASPEPVQTPAKSPSRPQPQRPLPPVQPQWAQEPEEEHMLAEPEEALPMEEDDYFQRYRKLYENFLPPEQKAALARAQSAPSSTASQPQPSARPAPSPSPAPSALAQRLQNTQPSASAKQPYVPAGQPHVPQEPGAHVTRPAARTESVPPAARKPAEPLPSPVKADSLPSLQELLKELEQEKLSGEEAGPMGDNDIDELINRITHD